MGMDGLGITASLGNRTQDWNNGIEVKHELTLLALWCMNGASTGWGRTMSGPSEISPAASLKIAQHRGILSVGR